MNIVINGVNLAELQALQAKVAPGASKFISDHIDDALALLKDMRRKTNSTSDPVTDAEKAELAEMAKDAMEHLQAANLVAGITGLQYDLFDQSLWFLEDADIDPEDGVFGELGELIDEMERNTQYWNASIC
jgi:hypothetical protein